LVRRIFSIFLKYIFFIFYFNVLLIARAPLSLGSSAVLLLLLFAFADAFADGFADGVADGVVRLALDLWLVVQRVPCRRCRRQAMRKRRMRSCRPPRSSTADRQPR